MITEEKRAYNRAYYQARAFELRQRQRDWRQANLERERKKDIARYPKRRVSKLAWMKSHYDAEKQRAKNRKYQSENKESIQAQRKAYRNANYVKILERNRKYVKANPDKQRAWAKRWYEKNKAKWAGYYANRGDREKCSPEQAPLLEKFYASVRARRWVKCYYCGAKVKGKDAHIDHVIALSKEGNHSVENLCVSCGPCNLSKGPKLPHEWPKHPQMFLTI